MRNAACVRILVHSPSPSASVSVVVTEGLLRRPLGSNIVPASSIVIASSPSVYSISAVLTETDEAKEPVTERKLPAHAKLAEAPKSPESLNCIWVSEPAGEELIPVSRLPSPSKKLALTPILAVRSPVIFKAAAAAPAAAVHVKLESPSTEFESVKIANSLSVPLLASTKVEPHTRESISSVTIEEPLYTKTVLSVPAATFARSIV